ncbi:MAG: HNH/ENDO VII family nuclease [Rhizobiaceae bacterium]|nr:HNH/ENDO VII family nuclease [Rhizobiaceae bacterium]MCV0408029.1 HNH/ENDO VII family nuclease [Rhizobiaceae bacterium]
MAAPLVIAAGVWAFRAYKAYRAVKKLQKAKKAADALKKAQQAAKKVKKSAKPCTNCGKASKGGKNKGGKPKSKRDQYMGRTPGKNSRTGREVQARMRKEGTLRGTGKNTQFKASNGKWYKLDKADMAHKTDAVKWWNRTGRHHGPKSPEVRRWMLDSKNYRLDHYSLNRSSGAKLPDRYLPPTK